MIENCNNLKAIEFDFRNTKEEVLESFGNKFGKSLAYIKLIRTVVELRALEAFEPTFSPILKYCPNLVSIEDIEIEELTKDEFVLQKLTKLNLHSHGLYSNNLIHLMVQRYQNTLNSLQVYPFYAEQTDRSAFLRQMSLFKNLQSFTIRGPDCETYSKDIVENMKIMANNCKQLQRFKFILLQGTAFHSNHFFQSFGHFSNLKQLSFSTLFYISEPHISQLNINCLKNCKQLTHLQINSQKINDNSFKEIDAIVPLLKVLDITTDDKITDKAFESISKLKNLEAMSFGDVSLAENSFKHFISITDSGLMSVINNCSNLKSIQFHKRPNITHKTIELVIEKALKNPKIDFKHFFRDMDKSSKGFATICMTAYYPLPINLKFFKIRVIPNYFKIYND